MLLGNLEVQVSRRPTATDSDGPELRLAVVKRGAARQSCSRLDTHENLAPEIVTFSPTLTAGDERLLPEAVPLSASFNNRSNG